MFYVCGVHTLSFMSTCGGFLYLHNFDVISILFVLSARSNIIVMEVLVSNVFLTLPNKVNSLITSHKHITYLQ